MQNLICIHFGIVLYEMLTARVPFDADTPVSVALKQVQEEPVAPIEYNEKIPQSVNMIILKAMQKNPNCRYQNATEMLEDLKRALKEPDSNFVVINGASNSPTQKIPTIYDMDLDEDENENDNKSKKDNKDKKKKGKLGAFFEKHKVLKVVVIFLIAVLLFFGAMFGTLAIFSRPSQVQIPNLVQDEDGNPIKEENAIEILEEAGLKNYSVEYKNSDDVEKGYVISQDPEYQENYTVNVTQEILLVVSSGSMDDELAEKLKNTEITLPKKMVGKTQEELEKEFKQLLADLDDEDLEDIEFWEIEEVFDEDVEAGIVVEVDDEDGEKVSGGSKITLDTKVTVKVSKGSEYKDVTVPNVVNKSESDARSTLEGLGLVVEVSYEENSNKTDGAVLSQSVSSNKTVKEGTTISLSVNKLPTKSTLTVRVNVSGFMKPVETTTTTDNASNDAETTATESKEPVLVKINVGDETIYNSTTSTDVIKTYKASGVKEVKVWIDNNLESQQSIDFSAGDQMVLVE